MLDELPIICADVDGLALVEVWEEAHKPCVVFDCILHARPGSTPSQAKSTPTVMSNLFVQL